MPSLGRTAPPFFRLTGHPLRWRLLRELAESDLRVRELATRVGEQQNLVSYHLRLLRDGGLVRATRSSFDGRDSYYHLDLDRCADALAHAATALHPALLPGDPPLPDARPGRVAVLFVCTGNSARSPIAEALLRDRAGHVTVASAGSRPKPVLHTDAVRVLREAYGVDVSRQRPRHLDTVADRRFHHVITMCDRVREVCPEFPHNPRRTHWSVPDPAAGDDGYAAFQRTAADIDARVRHLLPTLSTAASREVRP